MFYASDAFLVERVLAILLCSMFRILVTFSLLWSPRLRFRPKILISICGWRSSYSLADIAVFPWKHMSRHKAFVHAKSKYAYHRLDAAACFNSQIVKFIWAFLLFCHLQCRCRSFETTAGLLPTSNEPLLLTSASGYLAMSWGLLYRDKVILGVKQGQCELQRRAGIVNIKLMTLCSLYSEPMSVWWALEVWKLVSLAFWYVLDDAVSKFELLDPEKPPLKLLGLEIWTKTELLCATIWC